MNRAMQVYVAVVLTVTGGLTGAAIAFRWLSNSTERLIPGGSL